MLVPQRKCNVYGFILGYKGTNNEAFNFVVLRKITQFHSILILIKSNIKYTFNLILYQFISYTNYM